MRKLFTILLSFACMYAYAQEPQPKRPANFEKYEYKYSVEGLGKKFSKKMMKAAKKDMSELYQVNKSGKYKPIIDSLNQHPTPEWYKDAKLGIFFDWGLYSIAGYGEKGFGRGRYPDWYLSYMYSLNKEYHHKTWGTDFRRDDFIPLFTAKNFSADSVVQLAVEAGAKYFVPFNKHHDGYCLWDSKYTHRDVIDMNPHRDLTRELITACEKKGLKHGFYFSVEDYEYPIIDKKGNLKLRLWSKNMAADNAGVVEAKGEYYTNFESKHANGIVSGKVPVHSFIDDYLLPQAKDYIDNYNPDILWFDGEWQRSENYYKTPEIVAYFYNKSEGQKEVASNDRLGKGTREHSGDFYTSETDEVVKPMDYTWEENRSMSESYGYSWADSLSNYLTADELIEMLVRIVAKGGSLNLIVNPDGSGAISETQKMLLKELGVWLAVNGEAIYASRTYEVTTDNTQLGQLVWYTRSKDSKYGYAICFDWPKGGNFVLPGGNPVWDTEVFMLGYDKPLEWIEAPKWGLSVKIPEEMLYDPSKRPSRYAWVIKFEWDKAHKFGKNRNIKH